MFHSLSVFTTFQLFRGGGVRPIFLLRLSLLRFLDSNFAGNSLWAWESHLNLDAAWVKSSEIQNLSSEIGRNDLNKIRDMLSTQLGAWLQRILTNEHRISQTPPNVRIHLPLLHTSYVCVHIYIYIYIYREREREREIWNAPLTPVHHCTPVHTPDQPCAHPPRPTPRRDVPQMPPYAPLKQTANNWNKTTNK